jgi:hypothetical protein
MGQSNDHEQLHEDVDFHPRGSDLHDLFCGGQAKLQKNWQELSDERQEGMQLREKLRLRQVTKLGEIRGMKMLSVLMVLAVASTAWATDAKNTMCVKQKDGTYKCKASGKIEKKPCCDTPSNDSKPTLKHK